MSPELTGGTLDRDRIEHFHAVDHFHLVAVGIGEAHALAAAGLVDVLDLRGAVGRSDFFQILEAFGVHGDAEITRLA